MKFCSAEKYFIDYICGELDNAEIIEFHSHLENCSSCKKRLDTFNETHYSLKSFKRKDPPTGLVEQYHNDLAIRFSILKSANRWEQKITNIFQILFWQRTLSFRIAEVFGLILIGIFIGWLLFTPQPEIQQNPDFNPDYFYRPISKAEVEYISYYFQAAELLLMEIKNIDGKSSLSKADLEFNKSIAQKLLIKTFIVHEIALRENDPEILRFLSKMELLLYEVSNVPTEELSQSIGNFNVIINDSKLLDDARKIQREIVRFQSPQKGNINMKYKEVK